MHTMGEERDMFAGLEWKKEIKSLEDLHVLFTTSPVAHLSIRDARNTKGTRGTPE